MQSKNPVMEIAGRKVGYGQPCFIVAEVSANHHQKIEEAIEIIKAAKNAGADAVKLQTYTPDTMTLDSNREWFIAGGHKDHPAIWKGKTLYDLYKIAYTPWEWHPELKKAAEEIGIILFSTPFDETAVEYLEKMDVPCYKVASYEVTHIPMLKRIGRTGKPVIISNGFASEEELAFALKTLRENGTSDIAVLHCVTAYVGEPPADTMDLRTIQDIRERFGVVSGFSDNNGGTEFPAVAAAMGASIIEKHFILNRKDGGPDAQFSIEPGELAEMVKTIRGHEKTRDTGWVHEDSRYERAIGKARYGPANEDEAYNRRYRQSIWVSAKNGIQKGERLSKENIIVRRPEFGLPPKRYEEILGKIAAKDIEYATPLSEYLIE